MTVMKINFNALEAAVRNAKSVQSEMESYASVIPGVVNNPLSNLPMGSSGYTSSAASLATKKANELRRRASSYGTYATKINQFADHAKQADKRVYSSIKSVADSDAEGLNFFQKIGRFMNNAINGVLGASPFASLVHTFNAAGNWLATKRRECLKVALDWFRHGNGRYLLAAVAAVVGTLALVFKAISLIAACVATFPVGLVAAVIATVAAVVSVADTIATLKGTFQAFQNHSTEPGIARYYGNISDLSTFAKRETTDAGLQQLATTVDLVGAVAGIASTLTGLFKTPGVTGAPKYDLSWNTFKTNLAGTFGFTAADGGGWKFSLGTIFGFGSDTKNSWCFAETLSKKIEPIDNVISVTKWATTFDSGNLKFDFKNISGNLGAIGKVFSGMKIFGYPKKAYSVWKYTQ